MFCLQEDFSEEETGATSGGGGGGGSPPVTSQPSPQKHHQQQVFAMPAPPQPNENAALNQGERTVYTPGI